MKRFKVKNLNVLYTEKNDNVEQILQSIPVEKIIFPHQTHSCNIKNITEDLENCDGIYTSDKNIAIGIKTADCGAIVLTDFEKVMVVHAGWRGLLGGILDKAVNLFNKKVDFAFLSPFARSCCYEVKEDFIKNLKPEEKIYLKSKNGKYFFSMEDFIMDKLEPNVEEIKDSKLCTICNTNLYSYRCGDLKDRMLTIAWLDKE